MKVSQNLKALSSIFFLCVYVMYTCVYKCVHVCVYVRTYLPVEAGGGHVYHARLFLLSQGLSLNWALGWQLASCVSSALSLQSTGVMSTQWPHSFLCGCGGLERTRTQVLMLLQQAFLTMGHLPATAHNLYLHIHRNPKL